MLFSTTSISTSRQLRRLYSTAINGSSKIKPVRSIAGPFTALNIDTFRDHAFTPQTPLLVTPADGIRSHALFPAAQKWFVPSAMEDDNGKDQLELNIPYLSQYAHTILPYELVTLKTNTATQNDSSLTPVLQQFILASGSEGTTFHRFNAPLSLFLLASQNQSTPKPQLYIAQAQLNDLPPNLREDLPTPNLVLGAGKGDVYDSNIWLGLPPTYTPLHKDPNPNLFVQLASTKVVRIFEPRVGSAIFRNVRRQIGEYGLEGMRGNEMMEGKERELLYSAVWGDLLGEEGLEGAVGPMDALFIPKGWWHSIKSVGEGVTASVNWWFR